MGQRIFFVRLLNVVRLFIMRNMKRVFFAMFCAVLPAAAVFGGENAALTKLAAVSVTHNYKRGIERDLTACAIEGAVKGERFGVFSGLSSNEVLFDVTAAGEWWVFRQDLDRCSLLYGLDAVYHYQRFQYNGITMSHENDVMADFCFSLVTKNRFSFLIRTGYGSKISVLPALEETIFDVTPCVFVGFSKSIAQFEVLFSVGTHTDYRYPLFCSPDYALEVAYNTKSGFRPSLKGDVRINDQFTTAPYINRIALTAKVGVFLP